MNIASVNGEIAAVSSGLPATLPPRGIAANESSRGPSFQGTGNNEELRARFTQFVGETFFGQMLKAMRSTVGKPAYFHGGRTEDVFQGQLDQKLAEHLTEASADEFAEPMFQRQFPNLASHSASAEKHAGRSLNELAQLQRR